MTTKSLPPACCFEHGDPPGKQLFAIYNQGGPEEKRGIAWDGREVPAWDDITDQVREKWNHLASVIGIEEMDTVKKDLSRRLRESSFSNLPDLNHGHAWLLKFLYQHFRTDGFSFDVDKCSFSGNGKGIKTEREQDNVRQWFSDCVEHGAIVLHGETESDTSPIWHVHSLPNVTDSVLTLDPNITLERLMSEFIDVVPIDKLKSAACITVKGAGIPRTFAAEMYNALKERGAPANVLIIELPPGVDLSLLNEKQMRGKGWVRAQNKPRLWRPGDSLTGLKS